MYGVGEGANWGMMMMMRVGDNVVTWGIVYI
jgi:hypothetical protein